MDETTGPHLRAVKADSMMHNRSRDNSESSWIELTSRQRSIWLDLQASGSSTSYQIGVYIRVRRKLDFELFKRALADVVARHDALRLHIDPDQPRQRIDAASIPSIEFLDWSGEISPEARIEAFVQQLFMQPFPLSRGSLFQCIVCRFNADHYYCVIRAHHIILDAISVRILIHDLADTYERFHGGTVTGPPLTSSYQAFQISDAAYSRSARYGRDLEYWQQRFSDLPQPLLTRGAPPSPEEVRLPLVRGYLSPARYQRFLETCAQRDVRPGNVLFGLVAVLLSGVSGSRDVVLGVAVPGRTKEMRSHIGVFSSVIPLRVAVDPKQSVHELVIAITDLLARDYLHHRAPIDDICRTVGLARHRRRALFDVMVSYMPLKLVHVDIPFGDDVLVGEAVRGPEINPLAVYLSEVNRDPPAALEFAFNREYLRHDDVEWLIATFGLLFDRFAEDPSVQIESLHELLDRDRCLAFHRPEQMVNGHGVDAVETASVADRSLIHTMATFTAEPIGPTLQFWFDRLRFDATIHFAAYNQLFQELLDAGSAARRNRKGVNAILLRIEDWLRNRPLANAGTQINGKDDGRAFAVGVADEFLEALAQAAAHSSVPYLVLICPPTTAWDIGGPQADLQTAILNKLCDGISRLPGAEVLTYAECRSLYPVDVEYDAHGDGLGHLPYTGSAFAAMGTLMARRIHLMLRTPVKVIAVDADNTLWGGVVAEDGVAGIRLTDAHLELQRRLVRAAAAGVLICICSKNIEEDVFAVFDQRHDMVLKREHIGAHRINWQPKWENIRDLAAELNLGLDSFVLLDDNPIEVAEVAAACPQMTAIECRPGHGESPLHLDHLWLLDIGRVTKEDTKRLDFYRQNLLRAEACAAMDYPAFIANLNLRIRIAVPADADLTRLAQLTERTNQFNINGRKWAEGDLRALRDSGTGIVRAVFVDDRFGDYGLVALLAGHAADFRTRTRFLSDELPRPWPRCRASNDS